MFSPLMSSLEAILGPFGEGFVTTLSIVALSLPLALVVGALALIPRLSKHVMLRAPVYAAIEFLRNTPTFVLILVAYYGLPLLGWRLDGIYCGALAIAIQSGAYFAEVLRGGVQSIPRTQWDAARAIGMRPLAVFLRAILPQALLKVIPSLGNQVAVLIKDTSLVAGIGVVDLTLTGKLTMERTAVSYEVFLVVALFYLLMTTTVSLVFRALEAHYREKM
ncbi:amino acid ABC transporter permease [Cupriavidus sp. PET2-C1]